MGCRILVDKNTGETCFYCSSSMVAFGPIMDDETQALDFLDWMRDDRYAIRPDIKHILGNPNDPRSYSEKDLSELYYSFIRSRENQQEAI